MTLKEYNRKPYFQRLYAGLTGKALVVVIAAAMQMSVCADTLPDGVPAGAIELFDTEDKKYSLTSVKDDTKNTYYIPAGKTAIAKPEV